MLQNSQNLTKSHQPQRSHVELNRKRRSVDQEPYHKVGKVFKTTAIHSQVAKTKEVREEVSKVREEVTKVKQEVMKGQSKLNALLTRALESELQNVMIKVWQEFPDRPSSAAEAVVAEKFRNEAGDDLRNILGLSVTKRLLNVFNKLLVKVQFHYKPSQIILEDFTKKFNMKTFRKLEGRPGYTFVAEVTNIQDFDSLCSGTRKFCNIPIRATPCYRFRDCPPNLDSCYAPEGSKSDPKPDNVTKDISKPAEKENAVEVNVKCEGASKNEVKSKVKASAGNKATNNAKDQTAKNNENTDKQIKDTKTNNNDKIETKPVAKIEATNKTANFPRIAVKNIETLKKTEKTKPVAKPIAKKAPGKSPLKNKVKEVKKSFHDDDEELDDLEILKMLSGGIVIDECSGSDQE